MLSQYTNSVNILLTTASVSKFNLLFSTIHNYNTPASTKYLYISIYQLAGVTPREFANFINNTKTSYSLQILTKQMFFSRQKVKEQIRKFTPLNLMI